METKAENIGIEFNFKSSRRQKGGEELQVQTKHSVLGYTRILPFPSFRRHRCRSKFGGSAPAALRATLRDRERPPLNRESIQRDLLGTRTINRGRRMTTAAANTKCNVNKNLAVQVTPSAHKRDTSELTSDNCAVT